MTTKTGGGKITEIESRERAGKRALFLASGSHEADVKSFEYAATRALDARDDVTVMHYMHYIGRRRDGVWTGEVSGELRCGRGFGARAGGMYARAGVGRRVPRKGGVVAGIHSSAPTREKAVEG